ncbi:outer membrane lipoprotein LolB [Neisseria sp. 83E34]|uniref:outer membrane lipoprotein LolB n=1 Tax=Neisseria sp. 83E34 TaxID=1692264 RepID=UPI0006CE9387|nr:outer membrane lipoprotein LolB [Neisseria sp. 83E34]KPN72689.1 membrane protein [Neisseria sp. 83E34]
MKISHIAGILLLSAVLSACTSIYQKTDAWREQGELKEFNADGRLAVKVNEKGSYANFDWTYQNGVQTIDVNTPLGSTMGQLCQDAQGVVAVDSNGKVFSAATAQELSEQLLGYELPVQYLNIWAAGQWVKGVPHYVSSDGRLQQFNWTITRQLNQNGMPRVLLLESSKLTLRLVFDNMQPLARDAQAATQCAARGIK